jgi:hypothetical protein
MMVAAAVGEEAATEAEKEAETVEEDMVEETIVGILAAAAGVATFQSLVLCAKWDPTCRSRRSLRNWAPS